MKVEGEGGEVVGGGRGDVSWGVVFLVKVESCNVSFAEIDEDATGGAMAATEGEIKG